MTATAQPPAGAAGGTALLATQELHAGYGKAQVLRGIDLAVNSGEVLALFGRNGAGKTTLVHVLAGLHRPSRGRVVLAGDDVAGLPAHRIARRGVGLVPQGRRVFARLTVEEHLRIAQRGDGDWTLARVYELLPRLAERRRHRGDQLSGGEQQMLAIARALVGNPRLLLLDEPSDGLAPRLVEDIAATLGRLRAAGLTALLVEQNLGMALGVADRVAVLAGGQVVHEGTAEEFRADTTAAARLLGLP